MRAPATDDLIHHLRVLGFRIEDIRDGGVVMIDEDDLQRIAERIFTSAYCAGVGSQRADVILKGKALFAEMRWR